jgi:MFS family permease
MLVLASPLHSLATLLAGSIVAGAGHGITFLNAQQELNEIAPEERRGEVTAAFIACIYFLVAASVIGTGLLDLRFSLSVSVIAVSVALFGCAVVASAWARDWRIGPRLPLVSRRRATSN